MSAATTARIRWAPRLRPRLLERLYRSDAQGFEDIELCNEVGFALYARCEVFQLVAASQVRCPRCAAIFAVARRGTSACPSPDCGFETSFPDYWRSVQNHYAFPGRAGAAFAAFYRAFPAARDYRSKLVLIDQLIHSYHLDEQRTPVKSVASKLLEGNKRAVVRFLDLLSTPTGAVR